LELPETPGLGYTDSLRRALLYSHELQRERDPVLLHGLVLEGTLELLVASAARLHLLDDSGGWQLVSVAPSGARVPEAAAEMEAALLPRALAAGRSLISTHRLLDPDLEELAERCRKEKTTTHVLLIRAHRQTYGAVGVHWLDGPRPVDFRQRAAFGSYWDSVGVAVATALERARAAVELEELRANAFRDRLTGLANDQALQRELETQERTWPMGVLVLDFDGLREANSAFGNREGGDVLIRAVGEALAQIAQPGELPARMYTAGDEFALLLPGRDEWATDRRRAEVENALDVLTVPAQLRASYQGASVGAASRRPAETPGQMLGRAILAMRRRKGERRRQKTGS